MTALSGGLKYSWICIKHEKIEKVTGSQDDDFVGGLTKNIQNKLALMGQRPREGVQIFNVGAPRRQASTAYRRRLSGQPCSDRDGEACDMIKGKG
jgi:hypothetical protein